MPVLVILGTAAGLPDEHHSYTHMLLVGEFKSLLIDCGVNPIVQLRQIGLDVDEPTDMLLTHFHPDHVAGVPTFLMSSWLSGRTKALNLHTLPYTKERLEAMMDLFGWREWPSFFPIHHCAIPEEPMAVACHNEEFTVYSSPVRHEIPNVGLRIEFPNTDKTLVYSSDTSPCDEVVQLAKGANVLIHEATGAFNFHSTATEAGEIAQKAGVKELYLIHYPTRKLEPQALVAAAKSKFDGFVCLAEDFMKIAF